MVSAVSYTNEKTTDGNGGFRFEKISPGWALGV
jgi:hypothetical protein